MDAKSNRSVRFSRRMLPRNDGPQNSFRDPSSTLVLEGLGPFRNQTTPKRLTEALGLREERVSQLVCSDSFLHWFFPGASPCTCESTLVVVKVMGDLI